jgi:hypothetical protein
VRAPTRVWRREGQAPAYRRLLARRFGFLNGPTGYGDPAGALPCPALPWLTSRGRHAKQDSGRAPHAGPRLNSEVGLETVHCTVSTAGTGSRASADDGHGPDAGAATSLPDERTCRLSPPAIRAHHVLQETRFAFNLDRSSPSQDAGRAFPRHRYGVVRTPPPYTLRSPFPCMSRIPAWIAAKWAGSRGVAQRSAGTRPWPSRDWDCQRQAPTRPACHGFGPGARPNPSPSFT